MDFRFEIKALSIKPDVCPLCEGSGMIQHPDWAEYFKRLEELKSNGDIETSAEEDAFMIDFWKAKDQSFSQQSILSYSGLPPEETECSCEGKHLVDITLSESEILSLIGNYYLKKARSIS